MKRWVIYRFVPDDVIEDVFVEKVREFWTQRGAQRFFARKNLLTASEWMQSPGARWRPYYGVSRLPKKRFLRRWYMRPFTIKDVPITTGAGQRWAWLLRYVIPCRGGVQYLRRLRIIQTPWFGVYLHDFYEADAQDLHDHPWTFWSFVLRGKYYETYDHILYGTDGMAGAGRHLRGGLRMRTWRRFSFHKIPMDVAHRVDGYELGTISLCIVGPRRRTWGFYPPAEVSRVGRRHRWVAWDNYDEVRSPRAGS